MKNVFELIKEYNSLMEYVEETSQKMDEMKNLTELGIVGPSMSMSMSNDIVQRGIAIQERTDELLIKINKEQERISNLIED